MDRHCRARQRRAEVPESGLWEQEAGYHWLRLLVLAVGFVLGIKGGIGVERISEFFQRVRLAPYVGSSPTALRRLRSEVEAAILAYQAEREEQLRGAERPVEICAGADETFFDQVVLVMMDLVSGYIVLEEAVEDRTYVTWRDQVQQALNKVGIRLRSVVSDRAKALVKLALEGFTCPSTPDLFHALRDLAKVLGVSLHLKVARVEEKLAQTHQRRQVLEAKGQDSHVEQRLIQHLSTAVVGLRADQAAYQAVLEQASQAVHPFAIADNRPQSSAQVEVALHQAVVTLNALRARHTARHNQGPAAKFTRQIPGLAALIDAWWLRVEQGLMPHGLDADTQDWLQQQLLPAVYWQVQLEKTKTPNLRTAYQRAFKQAQIALRQHPLSATLTPAEWAQWQAWATELVRQFQRASSAVEGRNGYLSQLNHCARGTPTQRLRVMTVIHNFDLKRADGTTPAERLFGTQFPDLFDWVRERVGALPMPRRAKPRPKPNLVNLQSVPP